MIPSATGDYISFPNVDAEKSTYKSPMTRLLYFHKSHLDLFSSKLASKRIILPLRRRADCFTSKKNKDTYSNLHGEWGWFTDKLAKHIFEK